MDANPPAPTDGAAEPPKGLACHKCGCKHLFVVWTRPGTGKRIIRRRKCRSCGTLLYTTEKSMGG